jgi:glycosyltransferase involved in cell wall biosynthesis
VFTLCSLKEMMPIALLEATASGLSCVVNRHPVLQWISGPGGRAIDMAMPGELAGALQKLFQDESSRRQLGEAARRHCEDNFSTRRVIDEILHYYRLVASPGALRRAG